MRRTHIGSPFLVERLTDVVEQAWKARGARQSGLGTGSTPSSTQNRLAVYADGRSQMYGQERSGEISLASKATKITA